MLCAGVRKAAVSQLRNNRGDGFPAVIYKTCIDCLGPRLHRVIRKVRPSETIPINWSEARLLPHFKTRGGASEYAHRPICSAMCISLMDLNVKVF